jgi:beta-lactamase regulating signal transducer with metallopeptidase domain
MMTVDRAWSSLLTLALQSGLVCLAAGAMLLLLRKAAAACRHLVLVLATGALLAVPLLSAVVPPWQAPFSAQIFAPAPSAVLTPQRPVTAVSREDRGVAASPRGPVTARAALIGPALPRLTPPSVSAGAGPLRFPAVSTAAVAVRSAAFPRWRTAVVKEVLLVVWLGGIAVALLRLLAGLIGTRRVTLRETVSDPTLSRIVTQLQTERGIVRAVTVRQCAAGSGLPVPLTWGLFRPMLLLPATFLEWPQERQRMVLLHELAHIQRADWAVRILAQIVRALYWFHPLVWWTTHRLLEESERACDDTVLLTGVTPAAYAATLLEVIRTMNRSKTSLSSPASLLSMARPPIEARLRAILSPQRRQRPSRSLTLLASAGTAACAIALASVQVRAGQTPASHHFTPGVSVTDVAMTPPVSASQGFLTASLRTASGQTAATKQPPHSQKSRYVLDDVAELRQKLDTLEQLLVRNQQENAQLRQRLKALVAHEHAAIRLNETLGSEDAARRIRAIQAGRPTAAARELDAARAAHDAALAARAAGPSSAAAQLSALQAVLEDLQRQKILLKTKVEQTSELYRNGSTTSSAVNAAKGDLEVVTLQVDAVREQIDDVRAGRKISQKEQDLSLLRRQQAELQVQLRREQDNLVLAKTRYQAGVTSADELSQAELNVNRLRARIDQIQVKIAQQRGF